MDQMEKIEFVYMSRKFWIREEDVLEYTGIEYCDTEAVYEPYQRRMPSNKVYNVHNLPQGWIKAELIRFKEPVTTTENYYGLLREKTTMVERTVHIARIVAEQFLGLAIDDTTRAVRYIDPKKSPTPDNLMIVRL
jgi:hypothetical protein